MRQTKRLAHLHKVKAMVDLTGFGGVFEKQVGGSLSPEVPEEFRHWVKFRHDIVRPSVPEKNGCKPCHSLH